MGSLEGDAQGALNQAGLVFCISGGHTAGAKEADCAYSPVGLPKNVLPVTKSFSADPRMTR